MVILSNLKDVFICKVHDQYINDNLLCLAFSYTLPIEFTVFIVKNYSYIILPLFCKLYKNFLTTLFYDNKRILFIRKSIQ